MLYCSVGAALLRSSLVAAAAAPPALPSGGGRRAVSSSYAGSNLIQASSSSFELILVPGAASSASDGSSGSTWSNTNRRRGSYSMKKETSELIQSAIASTVMKSGQCDSQYASAGSDAYNGTGRLSYCPYQSMVVKIERAEWTQPEDPLTLRFYVVATIRSDQDYAQKRSQSSAFDLRQELDLFVLEFFYGDLFLATIVEAWADQDEDEVLTHAMMASGVELQVSESQGRIYQTRSPTASVVFLAVAFVLGLFIVDGAVRYATPVHLCASSRTSPSGAEDGSAVERETLNSERAREIA